MSLVGFADRVQTRKAEEISNARQHYRALIHSSAKAAGEQLREADAAEIEKLMPTLGVDCLSR